MSPVSRGFRHLRRASDEDAGRVPPGQYVTEGRSRAAHPGARVSYTLTRGQPAGWTGQIDSALLAEVAWPAEANPLAYICGPTSFVETAAAGLVGLGYPLERVRTERFGGTGGH